MRVGQKTLYVLFYLKKHFGEWKVVTDGILYSQAKFALEAGAALKEKGECVDYGYGIVKSPSLFTPQEKENVGI